MIEDCEHKDQDVRRFRYAGGSYFALQCLDCCAQPDRFEIEPTDLPDGIHPAVVEWAKPPPKVPKTRKVSQNSQARERAKYMRSAAWKRLRNRVLDRDDFTCQGCGDIATEAHHKTYDRFGHERLDDLQAACGPCNMAERDDRMAGGEGGEIGI